MRTRLHRAPRRRRGGVYVLVLITTTIVTIVSLAAIAIRRNAMESMQMRADRDQARLHAAAAVDLGLLAMRTDAQWRTDYGEVWLWDAPIGNGTVSLLAYDPGDGDLSNNAGDPVLLRGVGRQGISRVVVEADVIARPRALDCLASGLQAGTGLSVTNATVVSDQPLRSNATATLTSCSVDPGVEASGLITPLLYTGSARAGVAARKMPAGTSVVSAYASRATPISMSYLPLQLTTRVLENVVLGPNQNPYGSPNSDGIYVIDCGGAALEIRNCRVYGTLILTNTLVTPVIDQSVRFDAIAANQPVLLVSGSVSIGIDQSTLSESALGVNLNPLGAPYNGVADTDTTDSYTSGIAGLVYVTLNADLSNNTRIDGPVIVGGAASITGNLKLTNSGTCSANPPDGFQDAPDMIIADGGIRRMAD